MKTSDFSYDLPEELIAQTPIFPRDASRMLVCNREDEKREGRIFRDLPDYLRPEDVVVINHTRVIPARLLGIKEETGAAVEFLLLRRLSTDTWESLVKPGRRLPKGARVSFGDGLLKASVGETMSGGTREVRFSYLGLFENVLERLLQPLDMAITTGAAESCAYSQSTVIDGLRQWLNHAAALQQRH